MGGRPCALHPLSAYATRSSELLSIPFFPLLQNIDVAVAVVVVLESVRGQADLGTLARGSHLNVIKVQQFGLEFRVTFFQSSKPVGERRA